MCGAATYLMLTYTASVYELSNAAYMLPPLLYPFCMCVLWLSAKCALRTRLGRRSGPKSSSSLLFFHNGLYEQMGLRARKRHGGVRQRL
jgi:hypothetical protein